MTQHVIPFGATPGTACWIASTVLVLSFEEPPKVSWLHQVAFPSTTQGAPFPHPHQGPSILKMAIPRGAEWDLTVV